MNFDNVEKTAFESLKSGIISTQEPKGDEFPKIFAKAIREAIEAYDKEKQE